MIVKSTLACFQNISSQKLKWIAAFQVYHYTDRPIPNEHIVYISISLTTRLDKWGCGLITVIYVAVKKYTKYTSKENEIDKLIHMNIRVRKSENKI